MKEINSCHAVLAVAVLVLMFQNTSEQQSKETTRCFSCPGSNPLERSCFKKERCNNANYYCGITYEFTATNGVRVQQGCRAKSSCERLNEIYCLTQPGAKCVFCCDKFLCNSPDLAIDISTQTPAITTTTVAPTPTQPPPTVPPPQEVACSRALSAPTAKSVRSLYGLWYTYLAMAMSFSMADVALDRAADYFIISSFVGKMNGVIQMRTIQNLYSVQSAYGPIKPPNLHWNNLLEALKVALEMEMQSVKTLEKVAKAAGVCGGQGAVEYIQDTFLHAAYSVLKELGELIATLTRAHAKGADLGDFLMDRIVFNHPNFVQVYQTNFPDNETLTRPGNPEAKIFLPRDFGIENKGTYKLPNDYDEKNKDNKVEESSKSNDADGKSKEVRETMFKVDDPSKDKHHGGYNYVGYEYENEGFEYDMIGAKNM